MSKYGLIYIVSNSEQKKNLFKIGKTSRTITERIKELNSATGTLGKFKPHATFLVDDIDYMEKHIHKKLSSNRYQKNREFFEMEYAELLFKVEDIISEHCIKKEILLKPNPKQLKELEKNKLKKEKEFIESEFDLDSLLENELKSSQKEKDEQIKRETEDKKIIKKFVNFQEKNFRKNIVKLVKSLKKFDFINFYENTEDLSAKFKSDHYGNLIEILVVISPPNNPEKIKQSKQHHEKQLNYWNKKKNWMGRSPHASDIDSAFIKFNWGRVIFGEARVHYKYKYYENTGSWSDNNIVNLDKFFKQIVKDFAKLIVESKKDNFRSPFYRWNYYTPSLYDVGVVNRDEEENDDDYIFKYIDCDFDKALEIFKKNILNIN